jgi:hypothetical protein
MGSIVEDEEAGTAGRDLGDGKGWEERCKAGEDMVAWRIEGLVKPATRPLSVAISFGVGDDSRLRKVTRRSMPIFSSGFSFSLPLSLAVVFKVANSSVGSGTFFERVAVRILCSSDDLNR